MNFVKLLGSALISFSAFDTIYGHIDHKTAAKFQLIHGMDEYNQDFLKEYARLITQLLPSPDLSTDYADPKFLNRADEIPNRSETQTLKIKGTKSKLKSCSKVKLHKFQRIKTFQFENNTLVTLQRHSENDQLIVVKTTDGDRHYRLEVAFFKHLMESDASLKYFPTLFCHGEAGTRTNLFVIATDFIHGEQSHKVAERASASKLRFMVAQLFTALVELHKMGFVHCDLTPANVMVEPESLHLKLIDFGMSLPIGSVRKFRGSFYTRAPELQEYSPGEVSEAIDWWAFGSTVAIWYYYHHAARNPLLDFGSSAATTYDFYLMKFRSDKSYHAQRHIPEEFSPELRRFLSLFISIDPEFRTFSSVRQQELVRNHEYFRGFDWSSLGH